MLSKVMDVSLDFTTTWIFLTVSAIIIAAYSLLGNAYDKTCNSLNETIRLMNSRDQIIKFENYIKLMFKSDYQKVTCILLAIVGFSVVFLMDISLKYPFNVYLTLIAIFAFFSAGYGLWLAIASAYWISQLKTLGPLALNTVYPSNTLGIKKLSILLTTFSLSFSLELLLFLLIYFLAPWNNIELHNLFTQTLVFSFIIFMLFYFIYPQLGIKAIIVNYKEKNLKDLENKIGETYKKDILDVNDLNLIIGYNNLYKEINSSANFAIDFSVLLKFISSISVPLVFILKQNPKIILNIFDFIK